MFMNIFQRIGNYVNLRFQQSSIDHSSSPHTVPGLQSKQQPTNQKSYATCTNNPQQDSKTRNVMWQSLRAALRGEKDAQYKIGLCYLNGQLGLDRSYSHAAKWLTQAALQGHIAAKNQLEDAYAQLAFS